MALAASPLYLLHASFETPQVSTAMDRFQTKWLAHHSLPEKYQLHHYTTLVGMTGILTDRALSCGDVNSFNDPSEVRYGQAILAKVLLDSLEKEDRDDVRAFLRTMLNHVQMFGNGLFFAFAACFCASGNLLSQWRGYADRGGGYCLGFEFSEATHIAPIGNNLVEGSSPPYFRKVIYDEEEQTALVREYLASIVPAVKLAVDEGHPPPPIDKITYTSIMAMQAVNLLLDMLLAFKHPAFKSEEEWRLVRVTRADHQPQGLRFREVSGAYVPFRPTYIYDTKETGEHVFPLVSVGFGPTLDPMRTSSAVQLLLHHISSGKHPIALVPHVDIRGSGFSLRRE